MPAARTTTQDPGSVGNRPWAEHSTRFPTDYYTFTETRAHTVLCSSCYCSWRHRITAKRTPATLRASSSPPLLFGRVVRHSFAIRFLQCYFDIQRYSYQESIIPVEVGFRGRVAICSKEFREMGSSVTVGTSKFLRNKHHLA